MNLTSKALLLTAIFSTTFSYSQNLENGLVGYFPLNSDTQDYSSLQLHGSSTSVMFGTGFQGAAESAIQFSGPQVVHFGTNNRSISNAVSISVWFKTSMYEATQFISKYDYTEDRGYYLGTYENKVILGGRNNSGNFTYAQGTTNVNDGMWHHCVATIENNVWRVYIDCKLEKTVTTNASSPSIACTRNLTIGYYQGFNSSENRPYVGFLDEIRMYNRILTAAEMDQLCDKFLSAKKNQKPGISLAMIDRNVYKVLTDPERSFTFEIFDVTGKKVCSPSMNENIDLNQFGSGIYFLSVIESGTVVSSNKLLVQ